MPVLPADEARRRFAGARVARLATLTPDDLPHIVPITFAVEGDRIYAVVDRVKPKLSLSLARVRNITANPQVSILADEYANDWEQLWWVRADGRARIVAAGPDRGHGISLLQAKYPQYQGAGQDFGTATIVDVERWIGWAALST